MRNKDLVIIIYKVLILHANFLRGQGVRPTTDCAVRVISERLFEEIQHH